MTGSFSLLTELLADCDAHGIRLAPAAGDRLKIDAPQSALTPDRLARLKAHKADLLAMLRPKTGALSSAKKDSPEMAMKPVCRCGSTTWRDIPIHDGRSLRRDCARCGKFIAFAVWHGKHQQVEATG